MTDQNTLITEFKTVEGHPIVRDGEYETRDGSKIKVFGFNESKLICGLFSKSFTPDVLNGSTIINADGYCRGKGEQFDREFMYDLMRPWVEEPEAVDKEDGWIQWEGEPQPVGDEVQVEVEFRDRPQQQGEAQTFLWYHNDHIASDIIAYRVIVEEKKPEKQTLLDYVYVDLKNRPDDFKYCANVYGELIQIISNWAKENLK